MRINTNIAALDAQRNLGISSMSMQKSIERLSSGLRINRAADDAAGLSISEKMRTEIRGLNQAVRNAQDGISMVQTAEGALNEVHDILQRMNELALQGANGTLSTDDQKATQDELAQLQGEINRIANVTDFNGKTLLNGPAGTAATPGTAGAVTPSAAGGNTMTVTAGAGLSANGNYQVKVMSVDGSDNVASVALSTDGGTTFGSTVTVSSNAATFADGTTVNFTTGNTNAANDTFSFTVSGAAAGTSGGVNVDLQIGAGTDSNQVLSVNIQSISTAQIGNAGTGKPANVDAAMTALQTAMTSGVATDIQAAFRDLADSVQQSVKDVSANRSTLGAYQNRLEHTISNLNVASENLSASESRIRDVDMSAEVITMTRAQILQQAGTAVLAQANQAPQSVLSLLR